MDIMIYEGKKVFRYRRGAAYFLLFLALELLALLTDTPVNPQLEAHKADCSWYLNRIGGALTEENKGFLEEEAAAMSKADGIVQTAYQQYFDGQITEEALNETIRQPLEKLERRAGFAVIYQQYLYVRQDPVHRYFLDTNGWDALLSHDSPDIPLILALFLILAPVFCEDGKWQMDLLTMTMKKGGACLSGYKLLFSALAALALILCSTMMRVIFLNGKYGLPHGDFPLQSLSYFGTSTKEFSLLQAFLLVAALKTAGSLCLGLILLFGTAWTKKYAVTLLGCMAVVFLPIMGGSLTLRYVLPGPSGLLTATGFLAGDQNAVQSLTEETVKTFQEIPLSGLAFNLTLTAGLCFLLVWMIQRKCATKWKRHRFRFLSVLLVMCAVLSGCAGSSPQEPAEFNLSDAGHYETDRWLIYTEEDESLALDLIAEDKQTGEQFRLVRDVFETSYHVMPYIYGSGNYVYYMKMMVDKSETILYSMYERLMIQEVDLTDFSERTVFQIRMNEKNLLGTVFEARQTDWDYYLGITGFFLDRSYIYFISSGDICRVSYLTGKREVLIEASLLSDVAYDGQNIYYLNERFRLVKFSLAEQEGHVMSDKIMRQFYLSEGEIQ